MLLRVLAAHPNDRDALSALVAYSRAQGDLRQTPGHARRLAQLDPANPEVRQVVERLDAEARR